MPAQRNHLDVGELVPKPEFLIYNNVNAKISSEDGIPVREDVLFTNAKGEVKPRIAKRERKLLERLRLPLKRLLLPEEVVLYVLRANIALSAAEQLTQGWWTYYLSLYALVFTNKRILFFPVKRDGSWRESVRSVLWGDVAVLKPMGFLVRSLRLTFKNGAKQSYTRVARRDAKKISSIAPSLMVAALAETSPGGGVVQLCPDCSATLTPGEYKCAGCHLIFKNEKTMVMRSIFLPGGGYFYTGHPFVAIWPAIIEGLFLFDVALLFVASFTQRRPFGDLLSALVVLAIFWGLETAITILHCRRYIQEFIPEKRDPARTFAAQAAG